MIKQTRKHLLSESITRPYWHKKKTDRNLNKICLDKNENNDDNLKNIYKKIFEKNFTTSISYYPNLYDCYNSIAKLNKVPINNILIGAGSDGIIRSVFETFVQKGDLVLKTSPTFQMYNIYSKIYQAKTININYKNKNNHIFFDFEKFVKIIKNKKIKLICLPNPDSPTGTIISNNKIEIILKEAKRKNAMVLIDEAYFPFYNKSVIKFIRKYRNLIISRTFAKAWGLAGLRIGYGIANQEVIKYMNKVKSMYEVNTFAAHTIPQIVKKNKDVLSSVKSQNNSKKFFLEKLKKMGFDTLKSYGNFCHVKFGVKSKKIHRVLKKYVLYKENFSEKCLNGYSRFSLTSKNDFKKIINIISRIK